MAVKQVQVEVTEGSYDLGQGIARFVGAVKTALADGWQTGDDLPAIVTAAMTNLVPYVGALGNIGDEKDENAGAFLNAWLLAGPAVYAELQKNEAP